MDSTFPTPHNPHPPQPDPPEKVVRRLMRLADLNEHDYSCETVFDLIDQYAEMAARGEDVSRLMPLIQRHLELCPSCEDEYVALLAILKGRDAE